MLKQLRRFFKKPQVSTCDSCSIDASPATKEDLILMGESIAGWAIIRENEIRKIEKTFTFVDFKSAADFSIKVGHLAEEFNHHPEIRLQWGRCQVLWWSHGIENFTLRDLDLAAACNKI